MANGAEIEKQVDDVRFVFLTLATGHWKTDEGVVVFQSKALRRNSDLSSIYLIQPIKNLGVISAIV